MFADPKAPITTATFSTPGAYVLKLTAGNGQTQASSTLNVLVETPPPAKQLDAVYTKNFKIDSPLWNARAKALIVNWIPHCIDQINRTDIEVGPGGIDNFVEAGKKLRGEPHGYHKGYVFSNAWVHQTVESMSIALMIDPQGDPEIIAAHGRCAPRSTTGFRRSWPRRNPTAISKPRSRSPAGIAAGSSTPAASSTGTRPIGATTKATSPATSSNRPSTTT